MHLAAHGTTTLEKPENATCKKLADAGAVRIRWPADPARKEPETRSWYILQDVKWANGRSKDAHLSWRFTAGELQKRADDAAAAGGEPAAAARRQRGGGGCVRDDDVAAFEQQLLEDLLPYTWLDLSTGNEAYSSYGDAQPRDIPR